MYHMNGQKPLGFKNSSFQGMDPSNMPPMDPSSPNMPDPLIDDGPNPLPNPLTPNPPARDYSTIKIRSLRDIFVLSTDTAMFFSLFWINWWVIFVWF